MALLIGVAAPAAAQENVIPDRADQIEMLCPSIGLNWFRIGTIEWPGDYDDFHEMEELAPAPLADAELEYTAWSRRLAAITWRGSGFEGMEEFPWLSGVKEALEQGGWVPFNAGDDDALFAASEYRKTIKTGDGPREFAVKASSSGNFELTCGDAGLMALSVREAAGDLPEGSPRPLPPPADWAEQADAWLARFDCTDPALLAGFAALSALDQTNAVITAQLGTPPDLGAESDYQRRLETWLKWKLQTSGKLSQEDLWAIEDRAVTYDGEEANEDFAAFIGAAASLIEAEQGGDGLQRCSAARSVFTSMRTSSEREARRTARANAERIKAAGKLGIAID